MNKKYTPTSILHYLKLIGRSFLFIIALIFYVINRTKGNEALFFDYERLHWFLGFVWIVFAVEMLLRLFPSRLESPGCQKQFSKKYIPTGETIPNLQSWKRTFAVVLVWVALNAVIGVLYYTEIIDEGILILISLAYGVCDMICILFFCPFQTWLMKNRCCTTCRIYNWDFAMMFTPYIFVPHIFTWSLLAMSLLLLICWEITLIRHPERFSDKTNGCIMCKNCTEKLCHHKKQLQGFFKKYKTRFFGQRR